MIVRFVINSKNGTMFQLLIKTAAYFLFVG